MAELLPACGAVFSATIAVSVVGSVTVTVAGVLRVVGLRMFNTPFVPSHRVATCQ
jgi:hypothetical protein